MVNLLSLLDSITLQGDPALLADISLQDMQLDSRAIKAGDLFVAIQGGTLDGRTYIAKAIESGALAVLSHELEQKDHGVISYQSGIAIVGIYQLDKALSALAKRFYQINVNNHVARKNMRVVGVTGTNGKSTVTHIMASWVELLGGQAAVMGTLGNGKIGQLTSSTNTTGDAISIARQLANYESQGVELVAMEVSSHGLHQHRVAAVDFTQAIFTNLSRDHLDYHADMQDYQDVKALLLAMPSIKSRIINAGDPVGRTWLIRHNDAIAFGFEPISNHRQLLASDLKYTENGIQLVVHWAGHQYQINIPLLGAFNAENILAAMAGLIDLGYSIERLISTVNDLHAVPGRMECFSAQGKNKALMVVDYAHTPDALEKALVAARHHCGGKLTVIFGCGGDRDKGKRPLMGTVAHQLADSVILTDDNARSESAEKIVNDIKAGINNVSEIMIIHDRKKAIQQAFKYSQQGDLILIAGKGHENYQLVADKMFVYSDQAVVRELTNGDCV